MSEKTNAFICFFWGIILLVQIACFHPCLGQSRSYRVVSLEHKKAIPIPGVQVTLLYKDSISVILYTDSNGEFRYPKNYKKIDSIRLEKKSFRPKQQEVRSDIYELYLTSCQIFRDSYQQQINRVREVKNNLLKERQNIACYTPLVKNCDSILTEITSGLCAIDYESMDWAEYEQLRIKIDHQILEIKQKKFDIDMQTISLQRASLLVLKKAEAFVTSKSRLQIHLQMDKKTIDKDFSCFSNDRNYVVRLLIRHTNKKPALYMRDSLSGETEKRFLISPNTLDTILIFQVNPKKTLGFNKNTSYYVLISGLNPRDTLAFFRTGIAPNEQMSLSDKGKKLNSEKKVSLVKGNKLDKTIRPVSETDLNNDKSVLILRFSAYSQDVPKSYKPWVKLYVYVDPTSDSLYQEKYFTGDTIKLSSSFLKTGERNLISFSTDSLHSVQTVSFFFKNKSGKRAKTFLRGELGINTKEVVDGVYVNFFPK